MYVSPHANLIEIILHNIREGNDHKSTITPPLLSHIVNEEEIKGHTYTKKKNSVLYSHSSKQTQLMPIQMNRCEEATKKLKNLTSAGRSLK